MQPEEVKALIEAGLPGCEIRVQGDGSHFDVVAVGEDFAGLSPVKQQQMVYATLGERITSGEIHAINIKCYTPAEWDTARKLQVK